MKFVLLIATVFLTAACASTPPAPRVTSFDEARQAVTDSDSDLRLEAVTFLGDIRDERGLPLIVGRLSDDDKWVRLEATLALRNFQSPRAIDPLRASLDDPDEAVRFSAASALFELGDYSGEEALIEGLASSREDFRFQALMFLGKMRSRRAVPEIIKLLDDPSPPDPLYRRLYPGDLQGQSSGWRPDR